MTRTSYDAAFLAPRDSVDYVYGCERVDAIAKLVRFIDQDPYFDHERLLLGDVDTSSVEILFSTWGISRLTGDQIDRFFPHLKAVFYAAGTVGHFAAPFIERGITISSAWRANAIPVAELTVALITLAMKGYFRNIREYDGCEATYTSAFRGKGMHGETVFLLGAGAIGRHVIRLMKSHDVNMLVWDPFLDSRDALTLGVEKVGLDDGFERAYVVSNHLADKPETKGLISRSLLERLRENAVFINTGRGGTVDETALADLLERRCDLTAHLDVTDPEPTGPDSRLMRLPNCHISSHIAGAIGDEVHRMANLMIDEFERYQAGLPLQHQVSRELLALCA